MADLKFRYPPGGDVDYPQGEGRRTPKTKTVVKMPYNCVLNTYRQISADCDTSVESVKNKVIAHTKQMHRKEMLCSAVLMNMKSI